MHAITDAEIPDSFMCIVLIGSLPQCRYGNSDGKLVGQFLPFHSIFQRQ